MGTGSSSLWHALRRIIIPLHLQKKKIRNDGYEAFLSFILLEPFLILPFTLLLFLVIFTRRSSANYQFSDNFSFACIQCGISFRSFTKIDYGLGFVLGCILITLCFLLSAFNSKGNKVVKWRDRSYFVDTKQHPFHL